MTLSDGRPMWHHVATHVAEWGADVVGEHGLSAVGAVVGATHPRAVGEARKLMPQAVLLLPGRRRAGRERRPTWRAPSRAAPRARSSTPSRSVIYASRETGGDYREAAGAEAARLRQRDLGRLRLVARHGDVRGGRYAGARRRSCSPRRSRVVLVRATGLDDGPAAATKPPADAPAQPRRTTKPATTPRPRVLHRARRRHVRRRSRPRPASRSRGSQQLNPKVEPTSLFIGEQIRLR